MTAGLGGLGPAPLNAPPGAATAVGIQPGVSQGVVVAQYVIVFGPKNGVFVYASGTTPRYGNPPVAWMTASDTDPYGNPVTPYIGSTGVGAINGAALVAGTITATQLDVTGQLNPNPYFAGSTAGWDWYSGALTAGTVSGSPNVTAGTFTPTVGAAYPAMYSLAYNPVSPGEPVLITAYIDNECTTSASDVYLIIDWYNSSGTSLSTTKTSVSPEAGTWQSVSVTGTAPAEAASFRCYIQIDSASAVSTDYFHATNVQMATAVSGSIITGTLDAVTIEGSTFLAEGTSGQVLAYNGSPSTTSLVASLTGAGGTDTPGNTLQPGVTAYYPADPSAYVSLNANSNSAGGDTASITLATGSSADQVPPVITAWSAVSGTDTQSFLWIAGPMAAADQVGVGIALIGTETSGGSPVSGHLKEGYLFSYTPSGGATPVLTWSEDLLTANAPLTLTEPVTIESTVSSANGFTGGNVICVTLNNNSLTNPTSYTTLTGDGSIPANDAVAGTLYKIDAWGTAQWEAEALLIAGNWFSTEVGIEIPATTWASGADVRWQCETQVIVNDTSGTNNCAAMTKVTASNTNTGAGAVFLQSSLFTVSSTLTASSPSIQAYFATSNASQSIQSDGNMFYRIGAS